MSLPWRDGQEMKSRPAARLAELAVSRLRVPRRAMWRLACRPRNKRARDRRPAPAGAGIRPRPRGLSRTATNPVWSIDGLVLRPGPLPGAAPGPPWPRSWSCIRLSRASCPGRGGRTLTEIKARASLRR